MTIGQPVLLRLQDQYILAAVSAVADPDTLDVKALILQPPTGSIDVLDVRNTSRGTGIMQWTDPSWLIPAVAKPVT